MSNYFYDLPDDIITYIYSIRLKIAISKIHYTNIIKYMGIMEIIIKLKVYVDDQNFTHIIHLMIKCYLCY